MPNLKKMLQLYDHDLIERISSFWGVDAANLDLAAAVELLHHTMQDAALVNEVIDSLPPEAKETLHLLTSNPQKLTWAQFSRQFGEVRVYGPARREREEPEMNPVSTAEVLWYRGLIGKAFMNLPPEPREFVFVPDELLTIINPQKQVNKTIQVKVIAENSLKMKKDYGCGLVDHMTDWLAARRMQRKLPDLAWKVWQVNESFFAALAAESGLIDQKGNPVTDTLPAFFRQSYDEVLIHWLNIWKESTSIDDLKTLPGLVFESEVQNDPVTSRKVVLDLLQKLMPDTWYSLASFVTGIQSNTPDFQRPSGDYDSWFIRKDGSETYLRGFEHWDEVDGALIRYLVCGPLHWLGMIELGRSADNEKMLAFKKSSRLNSYFNGQRTGTSSCSETEIKLTTDLIIRVPLQASRMLRYQIARFSEIHSISAEETSYEITPISLRCAQESGLKPSQLIQLLEKQLKTPLPKTLLLTAENWEKYGAAARIEPGTLLRTHSPEVMQLLQHDPRTAKFIIEILAPTTALINPGGIKVIRKLLIEHGLLAEVNLEV